MPGILNKNRSLLLIMITDMSTGNPRKLLFSFCLPMLVSVAFQQLYSFVDSVVAGQFISADPVISENAVAAIGVSTPVTLVFMAIATGSNIGCSVLISQLFGAKKIKQMKTAVYTSILSVLVLSVLLTVAGLIFARPILEWLETPAEIMGDSLLYLNIYISSLFFLFLYNISTGIFTALGDSKTPLYFLIFSSLLNVVLDLVFVICFGMGVGGVGWATFIAQTLSAVLAFFTLAGRIRAFEVEGRVQVFSFPMLGRLALFAVPSILQQSFVAVGNLAIQGLINGYGPSVIAGFSSALKLNTFAITCFNTVSGGVSSYTAQNIGAGKYERVSQGLRAAILLLLLLVAPLALLFYFFAPQMLGIILQDGSVDAIGVGSIFMQWVAPFYIAIAAKIVSDGVLRGAGALRYFMISTFVDLFIRVALSYVLNGSCGYMSIVYAWVIGWVVSSLLSIVFYRGGVWKKKAAA